MEYHLIIEGRLDNLNDCISANRANYYKGAKTKAKNQKIVIAAIKKCLKGVRINKPVEMNYVWIEPNRRRDKDNISSFGRKVIQDALVQCKVLQDDGWRYIVGFSDKFDVDKENPRIEVTIKEA